MNSMKITIEEKKKRLLAIYDHYEKDMAEFKKAAACMTGCAECCIDVGKIDITSLEGIIIREQIAISDEPLKSEIKAKLIQNKAESERQELVRCAFLREDQSCLIYHVRPFIPCMETYFLNLRVKSFQ